MIHRKIDLYEYFAVSKPEYADGELTCWIQEPIDQVNPDRRFPSVLIFPGGAYRHISPRESEPLAMRYYASGFSAFVLSYSIAPLFFPTALREAAMAMRYIRENAAGLNLDPDKVAALGCSAGGHLLGCLAAMYESPVLPESRYSARPDAAIFCYPVITSGEKSNEESIYNISGADDLLGEWLSIEDLIHSGCPRAFIWHTFEDPTVPVRNSLLLADAYERAGVPFEMHVFQKGGHGMSTCDGMSNNTASLPECSTLAPSWLEASVRWLADNGIKVED